MRIAVVWNKYLMDDTDTELLESRNMQKLVDEFIQSGGLITKLPAFKTTAPNLVVAPPPKRGPGRPPKIK